MLEALTSLRTDPAPFPPAADARPGSGPADSPASLLQFLALRLEKGSPMHTRIMDLKEGLFQIGGAPEPLPRLTSLPRVMTTLTAVHAHTCC